MVALASGLVTGFLLRDVAALRAGGLRVVAATAAGFVPWAAALRAEGARVEVGAAAGLLVAAVLAGLLPDVFGVAVLAAVLLLLS